MENQPAAKHKSYVGKFRGHEHACRRSISYQIGTSRIPMIKSIILSYQNMVLTYPRVGIRAKYEKTNICFWGVLLVSNNMKMMDFLMILKELDIFEFCQKMDLNRPRYAEFY